MQEGLPPPTVHLALNGREVGSVLHLAVAHVYDEVAALVRSCRHHPLVVGGHDEVDVVGCRFSVNTLRLGHHHLLGDEGFHDALVLLVSGVEGLISKQDNAVPQVSVE